MELKDVKKSLHYNLNGVLFVLTEPEFDNLMTLSFKEGYIEGKSWKKRDYVKFCPKCHWKLRWRPDHDFTIMYRKCSNPKCSYKKAYQTLLTEDSQLR